MQTQRKQLSRAESGIRLFPQVSHAQLRLGEEISILALVISGAGP